MSAGLPPVRRDRGLAVVVAVFVASRALAHLAGLRFDASTLGGYFQLLDPLLLRTDLQDALWHLHIQPPLYNLALGIALKMTGGDPVGLLHATHLALGLVLALVTHRLLRRLGARGVTATVVASVLTVLPSTLLYEHWLYATYPAAVLVVVTALFLDRWGTRGHGADLAVALLSLGVLVLTRSLFHPVVLLLAVGGLLWLHRDRWRTVLLAAAVPVLGVALVLAHRVVVLDLPPMTASCGGLNLARTVTWQLTEAERAALVDRGLVSEVSQLSPGQIAFDRPDLLTPTPPVGSPAMDELLKSTGQPNYNHRGFPELCDAYAADALATARARPIAVARGQAMAWLTYFRPSSDFRFFDPANREALAGWERVASIAAGQVVEDDFDFWRDGGWPLSVPSRLGGVAWLVVVLFAVVLPASTWRVARDLRRGRARARSPSATTRAFLLLVVLWVTFVGNPLEVGENNRFRFLTNAPMAVLAVDLVASRRTTSAVDEDPAT